MKQKTENEVKAATIFDHLNNITAKKLPWHALSDADKKTFSVFIINRWLSMNINYIELVNEFQKYTIGQLTPEIVYKLYLDFLPKEKSFNKYVKGKKDSSISIDLIEFYARVYMCSTREAKSQLEILLRDNKPFLEELLSSYGKTDKEIKKLLNVKQS